MLFEQYDHPTFVSRCPSYRFYQNPLFCLMEFFCLDTVRAQKISLANQHCHIGGLWTSLKVRRMNLSMKLKGKKMKVLHHIEGM